MPDIEPAFQTTTLWDFPKQSYGKTRKGDSRFRGVTPAGVVWNLLQRYTKPGDLVVDPMCGSGTAIDVAKEEGRAVVGCDISPYRDDVIQSDARSIPIAGNSVDFVFIDSPYSDNIKYSEHPACIGRISCEKEEFFDELDRVAEEIYRILKPGKVMAWLIGDHWRKRSGLIPVGFKLYQRLCRHFEPIDLICVARRHQTSNTPLWHQRAREYNFYLRGFKHLIIARKVR